MITDKQKEYYQAQGFLIKNNVFSSDEINFITDHCETICQKHKDRMIIEENGDPYSIYLDQKDKVLNTFIRLPRLLNSACLLLNSSVYVHQIKLNHKKAMHGSEILWHEDYIFWKTLDKILKPELLTVAILLDDVYFYNSPLMFIPSSHKRQVTSTEIFKSEYPSDGVVNSWSDSQKSGLSTVVSNIRYQVDQESLLKLIGKNKIECFTGEKGSAIFFHAKTIHGSTKNISPYDRRMLFITYNCTTNVNIENRNNRMDFIAYRDNSALTVKKSKNWMK